MRTQNTPVHIKTLLRREKLTQNPTSGRNLNPLTFTAQTRLGVCTKAWGH